MAGGRQREEPHVRDPSPGRFVPFGPICRPSRRTVRHCNRAARVIASEGDRTDLARSRKGPRRCEVGRVLTSASQEHGRGTCHHLLRVDPRRRHLPRPEDAQGGSPALVVQPSDSQTTHAAPERYVEALAWAERTSRPLSDLADPTTVRDVLAACGRRLEGRPAAASVATRKRAALSLALVCAVEQGHLDGNR